MMSSVWTLRRRLIVGVLVLIWLFIISLFLAAWVNTVPTEISYATNDSTVSLRTDKSLALAYLQCVEFSWQSDNATFYQTGSVARGKEASSGTRHACNSQDTLLVVPGDANDGANLYPAMTWINPAALIFVGICLSVLGLFFWEPEWLGSVPRSQKHLLFVPLLISLVLLFQILNPLSISLVTLPANLILLPVSGIGFALIYIFRKQPGQLFRVTCSLMLVAIILLGMFHIFTVPGMLNYDERYYASIAATGASGLGLYPYIQNYPPMPIMGGVGGLAWLYVLAYKILGPTIWSLRVVVLIFYLLGLPAIYILFRRWYGTATAWLALVLIPASYFYTLSLSARMDTITLTWIWWGLVLIDTARRKQDLRWYLLAGLFCGLGLEAHIHTSITTIACGILLLIDYRGEIKKARRFVWPRFVILYSCGALMGLGFFVIFNILPNPDAFLRTAGNAARLTVVPVDKSLSLPEQVFRSFLAVETFIQVSVQRVIYIFAYMPWVGIILGLVAFATLLLRRRSRADSTALILLMGVLLAGFFILNGPSLYYTLHLFPVAVICLPSFFTHGYLRRGPDTVSWSEMTLPLLVVLLVLIFPLYLAFPVVSPNTIYDDQIMAQQYQPEITYIYAHVSRECILMGPGFLYQNSFMRYPRYNTHTDEAGLARSYYGFQNYEPLWPLLNPDIVFGQFEGKMGDSALRYIKDKNYREIAPNIWQKTHEALTPGCKIQAP